jgi:hypothetical protein
MVRKRLNKNLSPLRHRGTEFLIGFLGVLVSQWLGLWTFARCQTRIADLAAFVKCNFFVTYAVSKKYIMGLKEITKPIIANLSKGRGAKLWV